jgi:hypothetical protein
MRGQEQSMALLLSNTWTYSALIQGGIWKSAALY